MASSVKFQRPTVAWLIDAQHAGPHSGVKSAGEHEGEDSYPLARSDSDSQPAATAIKVSLFRVELKTSNPHTNVVGRLSAHSKAQRRRTSGVAVLIALQAPRQMFSAIVSLEQLTHEPLTPRTPLGPAVTFDKSNTSSGSEAFGTMQSV